MNRDKKIILVINPGSTSIKVGLYKEKECINSKTYDIDLSYTINNFDKVDVRKNSGVVDTIKRFIQESEVDLNDLGIVVSRGAPCPPVKLGAYYINNLMLNLYRYKPEAIHGSIIGPETAVSIAGPLGIPAITYDHSTADEADEITHITGLPMIRRNISCHALNGRMMCRKLAEKLGRSYELSSFVVAHLGGGISISAHKDGTIVDTLLVDEGPFSPTRAGRLAPRLIAEMCFSGKYTHKEIDAMINQYGGLFAHLQTSDAREVERRINQGDDRAKEVYNAMSYQISKCIGEMATALCFNLDGILITGGMAQSSMLTDWIIERVYKIAPVYLMPGEDELEALALGGLRVINSEEIPKEFDVLPRGFETKAEFYKAFNIQLNE